jgi:hypothetical protein
VLRVYAHEYEAARRREDESDQLAAVYDHAAVEALWKRQTAAERSRRSRPHPRIWL